MNPHFLAKLGEFFRSNKDSLAAGEVSDEDIAAAFKEARAAAGGKQKAANRAMPQAFSQDAAEWRLFMEHSFSEPPSRIQVFPKAGSYENQRYGKITLSAKDIAQFVDNHNRRVYQDKVPIDAEHQTKLSGAVGYFGEMHLIDEGKGGAEADVEWTERGRSLIAADAFKYFSPEWIEKWPDPVSGQKIANVLVGGAITTRPFFKDKVMRPLVANENGTYESFAMAEIDGKPLALALEASMPFTFSESTDEPVVAVEKEGEREEDPKKASLDVGDVHTDALPNKKKKDEPESGSGGKKMAEEPTNVIDDTTKAFVEGETKKLTEELGAEKALRQAAEARLVALETDAQTRRFSDVIMGRDGEGDGSPPFAGQHKTHNQMLSLIAKEFGEDSEQFKEYVGEQRTIAKQMREAGMFKEVGVGGAKTAGGGSGEATRRFNDEVAAYQTAHPEADKGAAIKAVSDANPALYVAQVKETNKANEKADTTYGFEQEDN